MCRPPCCNKNGGQGAGIAAVAILMLAALIAAKTGPIVADVIHTALEVIRLTALMIGTAAAVTALTWVVIKVIRWQLQRRTAIAASQPGCSPCPDGSKLALVASLAAWPVVVPARCCGPSARSYQPGQCPVCAPVARAG